MADKDREDADAPSLEMPSLGGMLRRRKNKQPADQETAGQEPEDVPEPEPVVPEPVAEPEPVATTVEPFSEPAPEPSSAPLFADEISPRDETTSETAGETRVDAAPVAATSTRTEEDDTDPEPVGVRRAERPRREFGLPGIPAPAAAAVTGAVVGLLAVGLTWLGLQGCEVTRGTQSCGGIGLLMLVLIVAAMIILGKVMLAAWGIAESMSISVLAVGLIAVVSLLFLISVLFSTWMLVVIPLVGAATYALAHWVTVQFTSAELD